MRVMVTILCLTLWVPLQPQLLERAQKAVGEGQFNQALIFYQRALMQFPSLQGKIYFNMAQTYWATGRIDSAQSYFEQSIHLLPDDWASEARNNLGFIQVQAQQYALGLRQFQQALTLNPHNAEARVNFELTATLLRSESPPPMNNPTSSRSSNSSRNTKNPITSGESARDSYLGDSLNNLETHLLFNQLREREKTYVQQLTRRPRKFLLSQDKPNW